MYGKILSLIFGNLSNLLWIVVFYTQLRENYLNKSAKALSFSLIYLWILGDYLSIISAKSKHLSNIIIYIAIFHIICDYIFVCQIIYYRYKEEQLRKEHDVFYNSIINYGNQTESENQTHPNSPINFVQVTPEFSITTYNTPLIAQEYKNKYCIFYLTLTEILLAFFSTCLSLLLYFLVDIYNLADIIAWCTVLIFISSRIPQILLNYSRKSTDGLSIWIFILINIANWLFVSCILIEMLDIPKEEYVFHLMKNIQWIIGSVLTTFMDIIIFIQFHIYKQNHGYTIIN